MSQEDATALLYIDLIGFLSGIKNPKYMTEETIVFYISNLDVFRQCKQTEYFETLILILLRNLCIF